MSNILDEGEIEAIGARTWRVDGSHVRLHCPRWGRVLRGTGSLEMDASGMRVRFYPTNASGFDVFGQVFAFPPAGQILDDQWYATGVLRDSRGRRWQLTRFRPSFGGDQGSFVISGRPRQIRCRKMLSYPTTGNGGELLFFPTLGFPPNRYRHFQEHVGDSIIRAGNTLDVADVEVSGMSLRFLNASCGECRLHSPCAALPSTWGFRICEALQFVTGKWHEWTIETTRTGSRETVWVRSPVDPEPSAIRPPMDPPSQHRSDQWRMFQNYLEAIWNDPAPRLHAMSGAHRSIIRASCLAVEAHAIQLGVSIEKILREEFADAHLRVPIDSDQISKLTKVISDADLKRETKNRILGAIGSWSRPRPQEILAVLAAEGRVRAQWSKLYAELRNPSVHGETVDADLQDWADRCEAGLTMFYELVLAKIGYSGPYSDYSQRNAPTISFPPASDGVAS